MNSTRGALEPLCVKEKADYGDVEVLRYRKHAGTAASGERKDEAAPAVVEMPPWLDAHRPAPTHDRPATIKPSGFVDDPVAAEPVARDKARERAIARGLAVHRLMQSLPDIPQERRAETARMFLARQRKFDDAESRSIAQQVQAVLADARFAALFGPGSRAEVSIAGRLHGHPVAGQVDRLVVTPDEVLIADYKSNRPPPQEPRRGAGKVRQLRQAACALPGRSEAALSGPAGARRAVVDRDAGTDGIAVKRPGRGPRRSAGDRRHHPVIALDAPAWRP